MKASIVQRMPWREIEGQDPELLHTREWLVTNGLGGYASGTISGACTRRYHGLLIAALPAPLGRTVMFNHLSEEIHFEDGQVVRLDTEDLARRDGRRESPLRQFRVEMGLPTWRYETGGTVL